MVTTSTLTQRPSQLVQVQQTGGRVEHNPATLDVDFGHDRAHERHQRLAAIAQTQNEQVLGRPGLQGSNLADLHTADCYDLESYQIPFVPGLFVPIVGQDLSQKLGTSQRFGSVAVVGVLESEQEDAVVVPGGAQDQRTDFRGVGLERRTAHEALIRSTGENLYGHLTAQSVSFANSGDDNLHETVLQRVLRKQSVKIKGYAGR